jgi:phospholipid/cholesterol/gamma-HCH transport system substrate-binding protein
LTNDTVPAYAVFDVCGEGLRVRGDVKERGVLVGQIRAIEHTTSGDCRVELGLFPGAGVSSVPANVTAQIRAKTIFGEKWVELLYPKNPASERISRGQVIPKSRTIDPLEVETILNRALPLLSAIDPDHLSGALEALASGFVGHEDAAIRAMTRGIDALRPVNNNTPLVKKGIYQLSATGKTLEDIDDDLLQALDNLDRLNRFTISHSGLIAANLNKTPQLLNELSNLFETRFTTFTKLVRSGATVLTVLAARTSDIDRLLKVLPKYNSNWIRNLNHVCRYRQSTDEPGKSRGSRVPGRCWRVHNIVSESQGAYGPGQSPEKRKRRSGQQSTTLSALGLKDLTPITKRLFSPILPSPYSGGTQR